MKTKITFLFTLVLALLPSALVQADDVIKIGVLTDLSGPASYYGNQTQVGALLAEEELKSQGKKIQVVFEDSALTTQKAISAAQKLFFVDKIDAIYVDFSLVATAVSSLVKTQKRLMIYAAAIESLSKGNPLAFKTYSDYRDGCRALAEEFKKRGVTKLGVLKAEAEYGDLCLAGAKMVYPALVEQSYKQGENVASQILVMKGKGVEAALNGAFEGDISNMLQAAKNIEYRLMIGTPEDAISDAVKEKFGDWLSGSLTFGLQRFPDALVERSRKIPGGEKLTAFEGAALGYVHVKQLYEAIAACKDRSGSCAAQALSKAGPDSAVGFEGWKNQLAKLKTVVKEYKDGKLAPIGSYLTGEGEPAKS